MIASKSSVSRAVSRQSTVKVVAKHSEVVKQISTGAASLALAAVVGVVDVAPAQADISGLTPCKESKAYDKRLKGELKGLNRRLKGYEAGKSLYAIGIVRNASEANRHGKGRDASSTRSRSS